MKQIAYIAASFALPMLALAQVSDVQDLGTKIIDIINTVLVPLVFALAFIVFLWGVFTYFIAGGANDEKRKTGQQLMIWGLVGFLVMLSVWGIINLLLGTLDLNTNRVPDYPVVPTR
jgi:hypothetical protein